MATRAIFLIALAVFLSSCADSSAANGTNLIGSAISTADAVTQSHIIFVGRIVSLGKADDSLDHESLGPEYENAKVKIAAILKGTFDPSKPIGVYPNALMLKEATPQEGKLYIFFIKYESNASNPYIVLKLLPATDDNIATVKKLISN